MSQIKASEVKALRDKTDAPMMECKKALSEAGEISKRLKRFFVSNWVLKLVRRQLGLRQKVL